MKRLSTKSMRLIMRRALRAWKLRNKPIPRDGFMIPLCWKAKEKDGHHYWSDIIFDTRQYSYPRIVVYRNVYRKNKPLTFHVSLADYYYDRKVCLPSKKTKEI